MFRHIIIAALSFFVNQAASGGAISTTLFDVNGLTIQTTTGLDNNDASFGLRSKVEFGNGVSYSQSFSKSLKEIHTPWFKSETLVEIATLDPKRRIFAYQVGSRIEYLHQKQGDTLIQHPYLKTEYRSGNVTLGTQSCMTIKEGEEVSSSNQLKFTVDNGYLIILTGSQTKTKKADLFSFQIEVQIPW